MRAAYTASQPSTPSGSAILPPRSAGMLSSSDGLSDSGLSGGSGSSLLGGSAGALLSAVAQGRKLATEVGRLPPGALRVAWTAIYTGAAGLLASKDLETCPVRGYLAQSRRETLAELVNAAILRECIALCMALTLHA